jgi:hypothetical protein
VGVKGYSQMFLHVLPCFLVETGTVMRDHLPAFFPGS